MMKEFRIPRLKYEYLAIRIREDLMKELRRVKPKDKELSDFTNLMIFIGLCQWKEMNQNWEIDNLTFKKLR